jgi:hypothetical protein
MLNRKSSYPASSHGPSQITRRGIFSAGIKAMAMAAAVALAPERAAAVPLYYSFDGEVVYSTVASHALGQSVHYVFLVDYDRDGYFVDGDGNIMMDGDYVEAPDYFRNSFYSEYIGGDALLEDNPLSELKETCYCGLDIRRYDEIFGAVRGSNFDPRGFDLIDVFSYEARFPDWAVGQNVIAENLVANGFTTPNSSYSSLMTLTAITDENPMGTVPEPSILAMFGLGLLGLGLAANRHPRRPAGP